MNILDEKKRLENVERPDPGRNAVRKFNNAMMDVNLSPVKMEKYSSRKATNHG